MTEYIVVKQKMFIIICIICLLIYTLLIGTIAYFYTEIKVVEAGITYRQEFIERYGVVQAELQGITFCYDPRGREVKEAVYKGHGIYKTK